MQDDQTQGSTFSDCFLGVDVGGTFTDLVFFDENGAVHCLKLPSSRRRPADSTLRGVAELRESLSVPEESWRRLHHTHSSTVATNALIERDGPRVGMLVTDGFRDILQLGRFALPHPMRFDSRRPTPLVRRGAVREVRERIDAAGAVLDPLNEQDVANAVKSLLDDDIDAVIVCFLHSYRNDAHERLAAEVVREHAPDLHVRLSSEVWPQAREYERATLASIDAFVQPTVARYARDLAAGLRELGIHSPPRVSRSNGGMELLSTLSTRPAAALLSGPAAGVTGAAVTATETGWTDADLLTFDVGGTSADIGVIRAGRPVLSSEEHIADFPLLLPSIAVSSIGAGGGSVLWRQGDTLKVGPRSVGAEPGPACYGNPDGQQPALTDAFLVAGLLADGQQLGGRMALQLAPAKDALERLGMGDAEQAADSAIQVAVAMTAAETMNVLSRRGVDVPEFGMVAFGGAGPLLAALLADEVHIRTVLIPHTPGALSASGAARADLEGDLIEPVYQTAQAIDAAELRARTEALRHQVDAWVRLQNLEFGLPDIVVEFAAEMRYDGQGYDVTVPLEAEWLYEADLTRIVDAFHRAHQTAYGHADPTASCWLNELRAHVVGTVPKSHHRPVAAGGDGEPRTHRRVRLGNTELRVAVYARDDLPAGTRLSGPAVIEQMDTTTFVPAGWTAAVHPSAHITMQRQD